MQALINGLSQQWQRDRSQTQMTLGKMIQSLEDMHQGAFVANLHYPHSYRGYYCDLAFSRGEGTRPASELLKECKSAMGKVFFGYKGGGYVMGEITPIWVSEYGECGHKLMALHSGGEIETEDDDD